MVSKKSIYGFSLPSILLISSCSFVGGLFSSPSNNSPIPPPVIKSAAISPTVFHSTEISPALSETGTTPASKVSPTVSESLLEDYFGFPYDPSIWTLLESGQEHIPPSLGYISDSYCSLAVNASNANLSVFIMVDKEIVLGKYAWTRRYFLDNHNNIVFEVYLTDTYPDEFYEQLSEGDYSSTGGIRLLGLYETCRQAMQELLAGMP